MVGDRFAFAVSIPVMCADKFEDGHYVFSDSTIIKYIESKRPSIRNKKYCIYPA